MQFRTEISVPKSTNCIDYQSTILLIGSCFSKSIGQNLMNRKFNVCINPFGTVYNPISIFNQLNSLVEKRTYEASELGSNNGLFYSYDHHSSFNKIDINESVENINLACQNGSNQLQNGTDLFITLGSAWVYELKETGEIVANCHKVPGAAFNKRLLTVDETVTRYLECHKKLMHFNKALNIVFTISPVRHLRDGFHENQMSKSTLFLAVEKIKESLPEIEYFPAYEIAIDDLRDYRFYGNDLLHLNDVGINYIFEKFSEAKISTTCLKECTKIQKLLDGSRHRPFNVKSDQHQQFLVKLQLEMNDLEQQISGLDLSEEKKIVNAQLL